MYDPCTEPRMPYGVIWRPSNVWCVREREREVVHAVSHDAAYAAAALLNCGLDIDAMAELMGVPVPKEAR